MTTPKMGLAPGEPAQSVPDLNGIAGGDQSGPALVHGSFLPGGQLNNSRNHMAKRAEEQHSLPLMPERQKQY